MAADSETKRLITSNIVFRCDIIFNEEQDKEFTGAVRLEQLCKWLALGSKFATKHSLQSAVTSFHLDQSWIWKSWEAYSFQLQSTGLSWSRKIGGFISQS